MKAIDELDNATLCERLITANAENETLRTAVVAAVNALRSYQYGNSAPDLAQSVADACDRALCRPGAQTSD